jgi:hypothetical protein
VKEKQGKENEDEQDRRLAGVAERFPTRILPQLDEIQHGKTPCSFIGRGNR